MTLQDSCVYLTLFLSWATVVHSSSSIACTITILASGVVDIWGILANDVAVALERVIMREGGIGSTSGDGLISKSHIALRLSPELRLSPSGFPLSNLDTLGHLLIHPSEELHVTGTITSVCIPESPDLDFVLNAPHLFNDGRSEGIAVVC
jgi:hypothetical protein